MIRTLQNLDRHALNWIYRNLSSPFGDRLMPFLSRIGNYGTVWILTGFLLLLQTEQRHTGLLLLIALAVTHLIGNRIIKPLVKRARPFAIYPDLELLIPRPHDYSFLSGHTASSFAAAAVLIQSGSALALPALILAASIAFSRLYMYLHYISDVVFGAFLGVLIANLVTRLA